MTWRNNHNQSISSSQPRPCTFGSWPAHQYLNKQVNVCSWSCASSEHVWLDRSWHIHDTWSQRTQCAWIQRGLWRFAGRRRSSRYRRDIATDRRVPALNELQLQHQPQPSPRPQKLQIRAGDVYSRKSEFISGDIDNGGCSGSFWWDNACDRQGKWNPQSRDVSPQCDILTAASHWNESHTWDIEKSHPATRPPSCW